jgi:hypothetical protein
MVIYLVLVVILALLAAINVLLPQGSFLPMQELPASRPVLALVNAGIMLVVYGGLGLVGLRLSRTLGFPELWDPGVGNRERFLLPAVAGLGLGILFIIVDQLFSGLHGLGPLPHPPFPTSLVASAVAGIGEEILFRLFFISFWVWLISHVLLKGKGQGVVFWLVAAASAAAFTAAHLPSVMMLVGTERIGELPPLLVGELVLLNGTLSLIAAAFLLRYGLLAAVGVHFWTDVLWHVAWGLV